MIVSHNFSLHWAGSSRFSLLQCGRRCRLLPAGSSGVRRACYEAAWQILACSWKRPCGVWHCAPCYGKAATRNG